MAYLRRGMILPALFIVTCLVYYMGFWDHQIRPIFPRDVEKIQTASSGRVSEGSYKAFYIVNSYSGSSEDQAEIENYAKERYDSYVRQNIKHSPYDIVYYFVSRELYDPMDDAVNRAGAVTIFKHSGTNESPTLNQVK